MAYKQSGWSAFSKKDPKLTKKRIIKATDIETKVGHIPTEQTAVEETLGQTGVYRKGLKKFIKMSDGEFKQITRKGKKVLKDEGSYVSGKTVKKLKDIPMGPEWQKFLDPNKKKK
tara:strand:- start:1970 stop:2314 length:345 start_codon:yes stop_codon:yes gene_type:complete